MFCFCFLFDYSFFLFEPVLKLVCMWKQKYGANVNKSSSLETFFKMSQSGLLKGPLLFSFIAFKMELQSTPNHVD